MGLISFLVSIWSSSESSDGTCLLDLWSSNFSSSSSIKLIEDDVAFLKSKVKDYDKIFTSKRINEKNIKLYSLYLQGICLKDIGKIFKRSKHQVAVEIFRIKQKIKKHGIGE
jgi:hypothetical protein